MSTEEKPIGLTGPCRLTPAVLSADSACFVSCRARSVIFGSFGCHNWRTANVDGPSTRVGQPIIAGANSNLRFQPLSHVFFYFSCSSHRGWVVHAHYNMQSRAAMAVIIIIKFNCSYFVSPTATDEITNREKRAQ